MGWPTVVSVNTNLTFITPVSPDHVQYLPACKASVASQTIPCQHLWLVDDQRRGPGYIRNRLLDSVTTEYVTFLDADDWVEPEFAEHMLRAVVGSPYAYCSWFQDGIVKEAPARAWCNRTFHLITSVYSTQLARMIGGFDEGLSGLEDTDFNLKFITREWCGVRVMTPLVHYRAHGGRSDAVHQSGQIETIRAELDRRYGGKPLGCCGNPIEVDSHPIGEKQDGDVLAMALWGGNRTELGRATGRRYPRTSYPKTCWVNPADIRVSPHLWKVVVPEQTPAPQFELSPLPAPRGIDALRTGLVSSGTIEEAGPPAVPELVAPIANAMKIKRMAGAVDLPVFVAPRTSYPSYADLWKLVELAGFEMVHQDEIDLADGNRVYIFTGPDGIPDCSNANARTIFWQLEYVGDYTDQANIHTVGEIWSSDPEHASLTGAKFVLMGSHKGLNPTLDRADSYRYDLSMLAYMTPRRETIKDALSDYEWAPDYPGHGTAFRHDILRSTCLMLNVNQFDAPALTPLRLALAAAYSLPVLAERVPNIKPYGKGVIWATYGQLAAKAKKLLADDDARATAREALYELLCEEHPFFDCVMEALQ